MVEAGRIDKNEIIREKLLEKLIKVYEKLRYPAWKIKELHKEMIEVEVELTRAFKELKFSDSLI